MPLQLSAAVPVSPSQSSASGPPSKPPLSSSSSYTCIFGGRTGVAAPATPAPAPGEGRGRLVVSESPAPEASLDLAGQVSLEHNVAGLVEHLKGCCFLLEVE